MRTKIINIVCGEEMVEAEAAFLPYPALPLLLSYKLFQEGKYGETVEVLEGYMEQELRLHGRDASLMHTLTGVASARLGMDDRAALHFSRAVKLDRENELAALNLKLVQEYPF